MKIISLNPKNIIKHTNLYKPTVISVSAFPDTAILKLYQNQNYNIRILNFQPNQSNDID
jgi:hypothetical protein